MRAATATLLSILGASHAAPAGWRDVMVYVGNHTLGDPPGSTFSQEMQDIAVLRVGGCQRGAFFVDIAAHTALRLSNTRALERDWGWDGICVEANHLYWHELAHRKCRVAAVVLGAGHGPVHFDGSLGAMGRVLPAGGSQGVASHALPRGARQVGGARQGATRKAPPGGAARDWWWSKGQVVEQGTKQGTGRGGEPSDVVTRWLQDVHKHEKERAGTFARATLPTDAFLRDLDAPRIIDYVRWRMPPCHCHALIAPSAFLGVPRRPPRSCPCRRILPALANACALALADASSSVCAWPQVSLDVEGAEESILRAFPFGEFRVRILIVERPDGSASIGGRHKSISALLKQHGIERVGRLPDIAGSGDVMFVTPELVPGGLAGAKAALSEVVDFANEQKRKRGRPMKSYIQMLADQALARLFGAADSQQAGPAPSSCTLKEGSLLRKLAEHRYVS